MVVTNCRMKLRWYTGIFVRSWVVLKMGMHYAVRSAVTATALKGHAHCWVLNWTEACYNTAVDKEYENCQGLSLFVICRAIILLSMLNSQIAKICWQDHVRNTDVSSLTGLGPVLDPIVRRPSSLFGHVARLPEDTPAHQALRCSVDLSLGHLPDPSWRRCPGWPIVWAWSSVDCYRVVSCEGDILQNCFHRALSCLLYVLLLWWCILLCSISLRNTYRNNFLIPLMLS